MAWINEFHYDNGGTDAGEFIEIAATAGTNLAGYSLVLYNGSGGAPYLTTPLTGVIPNQANGFGTLTFAYPVNGVQNGSPDGIALVGPDGVVIEFISYEGSFTAVGGPANGMTSVDVGVSEPGTANGTSIARAGSGDDRTDFTWTLDADDTPGGVNNGQTFQSQALPLVSVGDGSLGEGDSGTRNAEFLVTLSTPSASVVTVQYATAPGTADAADFVASTGTVTFQPGETSKVVAVAISGDTVFEPDESFTVNLSNPAGADIDDGEGVVTILNDDVAPPAADPWINEFHYDNSGADIGEFVEIAGAAGTDLTGWRIALYNGNPTQRNVYATLNLTGSLPDQGGGFGTVSVPAVGIQNGGTATPEPDGIALIRPDGSVVEFISYEGSFTAASGPAAGMTSTDVGFSEPGNEPGTSIGRIGTGDEASDFAWAKLTDDTPGAANSGQNFGTVTPISVSINDVSRAEGDSDTSQLTFTVTRTGGTGAFSVEYVTTGGNATVDEDYTFAGGTLSFAEGETIKTITVDVTGDTIVEPSETFEVRLFNPTEGALIADSTGIGTIANDDVRISRIHEIQGDAFFSPVLAAEGISNFNIRSTSEVTVRAIVTAVDAVGSRQGFYITEEISDWDGNVLSSEGIFVMTRDDRNNGVTLDTLAPGIRAGDLVTVSASVMEYQAFSSMPRTMLTNPSAIVIGGSGFELPTLVLDGSPGRQIPNSILTDEVPDFRDSADDAADTFDPANDALDYFETIEGMLVTVPDMVVADGFVDTAGGDPFLKAYSTVHADANQINDRGGYTIAGEGTLRGGRHLHDGDVNPDIIELDFTDFAVGAPADLAEAASMGDRLGDVTGIIDFDFTDLKLFVTEPIAPVLSGDPEIEVTTLGGDARSLTVSTFNVENLDANDAQSRFDDIAEAIATNLNAPDIISIEEIQDNNGAAAGDGTSATGADASATWDKLVAALNLATGEKYQWVDELPAYNAEGGEQSGNIRVGFLYNTNRVQLGDLAADATIAQRRAYTDRIGDATRDAGDLIAFDDSQIASEINATDWTNTRKSLLGEFVFNGNTVYVTANHWPSKGGSGQFWQFNQNLDAGQPQNRDWDQRSEIGQDVWTMLDRIQAASGDNRIVAGGDFNDFYFYRPLEAVTGYVTADGVARVGGARFDNLTVTELSEAERYTYAFDGRSQAIDHIIVDQQLSAVASYDVVHINTGYNSRSAANPALSDHDPGLAQFDFRNFSEVLKGTSGDDLIDGFGGDDTLVYAGARSDYRVTLNAAGEVVIEDARAGSPDGRDTARNIEALQFNGERFAIPANGTPTAANDTVAVDEDATSDNLWETLLTNDTDVDFYDDTLAISAIDTSATKGSVIFDPETKTLKYVADDDSFDYLFPGQTATDRFSYTVSDGQGGTSTATVEVTVTGRFDTELRFGGNRDDTLTAGAGEDFLYGGNGNDTLYGLGGHDLLYGDNGNDKLFGGDGNDWLFGGNGDDQLDGGAGNDRLAGGNGNDLLTGGEGENVFVIGRGGGRDQITDFDTASDSIFLEWGTRVSKSRVEDVNRDGVLDLNVTLSGGGGSVALLGVTDIDAVSFTGPADLWSAFSDQLVNVEPLIF